MFIDRAELPVLFAFVVDSPIFIPIIEVLEIVGWISFATMPRRRPGEIGATLENGETEIYMCALR